MILSENQEWYGETFEDIIFVDENLHDIGFYDCTFKNCAFNGSSFKTCVFEDCRFVDTDLSLCKLLDSKFSGVVFSKCKTVGINWNQARWQKNPIYPAIAFEDSTLDYGTFIGMDLRGTRISNSSLRDVDFREVNLTKANLSGSDFTDALFSSSNLTEADLRRAVNYHIDMQQNTIRGAKFTMPEAMALLYASGVDIVE